MQMELLFHCCGNYSGETGTVTFNNSPICKIYLYEHLKTVGQTDGWTDETTDRIQAISKTPGNTFNSVSVTVSSKYAINSCFL